MNIWSMKKQYWYFFPTKEIRYHNLLKRIKAIIRVINVAAILKMLALKLID